MLRDTGVGSVRNEGEMMVGSLIRSLFSVGGVFETSASRFSWHVTWEQIDIAGDSLVVII